MNFRQMPIFHIVILVLFFVVLGNLIVIDIWISLQKPSAQQASSVQQNTKKSSEITKQSEVNDHYCPVGCLSQIYQATSSAKPIPTAVTPKTTSSVQRVKDYYIPLGSGSNSSSDWQDLSGIQATVNSADYTYIKSVTFEAAVTIPTGNQTAYVRLFNLTDQHPVWFSEVSLTGGTPQLLISQPITLDSGSKLYGVQMKTSLQFQANLDQARIHITLY